MKTGYSEGTGQLVCFVGRSFSLPLSSVRFLVREDKMQGLTLPGLCAEPPDLELLQTDGLSRSVSTN